MLKINEIYTKVISESVSDELKSLSTKQVEDLLNSIMDPGINEKVYFSKFIKMENDVDARYVIVTFDDDENEYLVNYFTATLVRGNEIIYGDCTCVPEETFEKLDDAIAFAKSINESDIFGNPDKNSQGTVIPDIKEADEKQISIEDIGNTYSDWLDYVIKQENIGANIIDSDPKQAPQALVTIIKALGYIPAPNLIEKFLIDTPELYSVIVNYIKKTLNSEKGIDWAMSLEHTLKDDYNVKTSIPDDVDETSIKEGNSLANMRPSYEEDIWTVFEEDFDTVKNMTKQELYDDMIKGGTGEPTEGYDSDKKLFQVIQDEWKDLQKYKAKRIKNPAYRLNVNEDEFDDLDAAIKQDLEATKHAVRESIDQEELFDALSKLVDAEYESLQDFPNHEKLYDYAVGMFPKIEPETVEKVWNIYFA